MSIHSSMTFGVIGSGSWATALVKILTDNGQRVNWWVLHTGKSKTIMKVREESAILNSILY